MQHYHSSNFWLSQFVLRLMELQPGLPMLHAVQYAVLQYPYAGSLEPERAAAIFASGHPGLVWSIPSVQGLSRARVAASGQVSMSD